MLRERTRVGCPLLLNMTRDLARRASAEAVGTALLVAIVIGSGIYAQRLSPEISDSQLLENSIATGAGLVALILAFGRVSGAHFNPVVTLADRLLGGTTTRAGCWYAAAQVVGACVGAMVANLMFSLPRRERLAPHARRPVRSGSASSLQPSGCSSSSSVSCAPGRAAFAPFAVGGVHRRGLLVHVVDQLREPGGDHRPHVVGHVRGYPSVERADVHRHGVRRRSGRGRGRAVPGIPNVVADDIVVPHDAADA